VRQAIIASNQASFALHLLCEFAEVAAAWDALPDPIRAALLALIRNC
jgi:hypothetical protein